MPGASRAVAICVVAVVLAPTPSPVAAQATAGDASPRGHPTLPVGAHLRVRRQGSHGAVFSGRLRTIRNDSIALALDGDSQDTVLFAYADIGRAELERDEKTRDQAASAMGAVGAVGGLTAAVYWCVHNQTACEEDVAQMLQADDNDESNIGPSGLMVLGGALVGSALGWILAPQPHWELVVFPTRTATSNGSTRLLMNVGVSIPLGGQRRR